MQKNLFFSFLLISLSFTCVLQVKALSGFTPDKTQLSNDNSSSTDTSDSKKSLLLEIDYGTNRGYQLRRRTAGGDTSQKYISPNINYESNSGFFANMVLYKTPGAKKKWDEFLFGLGWDFKISKSADVDGSVGYTHLTYNEAIKQNGINPAGNQLTAYAKHDFSLLALKITGDYYFGGTYNDEDIIIDLDHEFDIDNVLSKKDELSIDPTFTVVGATLNYYINTKVPQIPGNSPKKKELQEQLQTAINDYGMFRLAYYELALPVNYEIGKFDMEIAWRYSIPNNLPASLNAKAYSYITALISWDFIK